MKHATGRVSNIFQLFDTSEKPNHFVAENQGRDGARQENVENEWYDLEYQGTKAKAPQHPTDSPGEEDHWEVVEETRRRRIAFENLAKGMLTHLDNCNDVKVDTTEL